VKKPTNSIKATFSRRVKKDKGYRHWVLLQLHKRQTKDERNAKTTIWNNQVGFTTIDAPLLTNLAEQVRDGKKLSAKLEQLLVQRLPKYWGQFIQATLAEPASAQRRAA
jgi:hypothetical protein